MYWVQLSTRSMLKPIVTFDGQVLEVFTDQLGVTSMRVHIGHMRTVSLAPVSRGKEPYLLTVQCEYQVVAVDVSEQALPAAQQLVEALRAAIASVQQPGPA